MNRLIFSKKNHYNKDTWISLRILIKSKLNLKEYVVTTFRREMNMKCSMLPVHAFAVWTDTGPHCCSNGLSFLISQVHFKSHSSSFLQSIPFELCLSMWWGVFFTDWPQMTYFKIDINMRHTEWRWTSTRLHQAKRFREGLKMRRRTMDIAKTGEGVNLKKETQKPISWKL